MSTLDFFRQGELADAAAVGGGTGNDEKVRTLLLAVGNTAKVHRWASFTVNHHFYDGSLGFAGGYFLVAAGRANQGMALRHVSVYPKLGPTGAQVLTLRIYREATRQAVGAPASGQVDLVPATAFPGTNERDFYPPIQQGWVKPGEFWALVLHATGGGTNVVHAQFVLRWASLHRS